ncbi:MAG: DUF192 domain-containing protein [Candidatus Diapherotrites archaeon]
MLYNKTRRKEIIGRIKKAGSFWGKFKGLMLERKEKFNYGLVFDFRAEKRIEASIHMLFVFFPIDLVYLNKEKKVIELKHGIKPWSLNYTPKRKAHYLIELPEGTIKKKKIGLKDELKWN